MVELFLLLHTSCYTYSASSTSWFSLIMEIPEGSNMDRSWDIGDTGRCSKQSSKRCYGAKENDLLAVNQSKKDGAPPKKELLSQFKKKSQKKEDI